MNRQDRKLILDSDGAVGFQRSGHTSRYYNKPTSASRKRVMSIIAERGYDPIVTLYEDGPRVNFKIAVRRTDRRRG